MATEPWNKQHGVESEVTGQQKELKNKCNFNLLKKVYEPCTCISKIITKIFLFPSHFLQAIGSLSPGHLEVAGTSQNNLHSSCCRQPSHHTESQSQINGIGQPDLPELSIVVTPIICLSRLCSEWRRAWLPHLKPLPKSGIKRLCRTWLLQTRTFVCIETGIPCAAFELWRCEWKHWQCLTSLKYIVCPPLTE